MIKNITLFMFLIASSYMFSQKYVIGKVVNDASSKISDVLVLNTRTDEKVWTDGEGQFMIRAEVSDELRFVRQRYERVSTKIKPEHFAKAMEIQLNLAPADIEEVKLGFRATGNLKKDVVALNQPAKVVALNTELRSVMKQNPNQVPTKNVAPSAFAQRDFSAGQVNVLGLAKAAIGLIKKAAGPEKTTANYSETQAFYAKVKQAVNFSDYEKYGLDEYDFEQLVVYADKKFNLAKNYRNNFDKKAIDGLLKEALNEFLKTKINS